MYVSWSLSRSSIDLNRNRGEQADQDAAPFPPIYREMFNPQHDHRWEKAWKITEALLAGMKNFLDRHGVDFLVVVIPSPLQAHPVPGVRQKGMDAFDLRDLSYPEKRISEIARRHHLSGPGRPRYAGHPQHGGHDKRRAASRRSKGLDRLPAQPGSRRTAG